jgi:D-arabinose 1-dehydrogenase-like Zn-dependent alcohol dehydrogenase
MSKLNHLTSFVYNFIVYHSIHNNRQNEGKHMVRIYKAIQVTNPGKLDLVELPIREPGPGQVRLRVEACGVCHSDVATVEGQYPGLILPRVPGHEVVGRIDAVGSGVSNWKIGQRVGVGFFGGQDGECESCQRGDFVNCVHPSLPESLLMADTRRP